MIKRFLLLCLVAWPACANGATTINGNALALLSDGTSSGNSWVLDADGYVGTYITLASPGNVTIDVNASGTASGGISPNMNVVIADTKASYSVTAGTYSHTYALPAGTFFVRCEFNNDQGATSRQLKVNSVQVTGAIVSNSNSNSNALAASDSYIANYRKGNAAVKIAGVGAGQQVAVSLKKIKFDFGGGVTVNDDGSNSVLGNNGTTTQQNYQALVNQNFNAITTTGPGYWNGNEPTQGNVRTGGLQSVYSYAAAHGMNARQHNLIWESAQPSWIETLKSQAVTSTTAKANLSAAIQSRINYYLAGSTQFNEVDLYNESYNSGQQGGSSSYWNLYGASGIAKMYHDAKVAAAGYSPKVMVNEYAVLQGASNPFGAHVDALTQAGINAGYGNVVDGVGVQFYTGSIDPSLASTWFYGLQNMDVRNLPITLTEFGTFTSMNITDAATVLGQALRLQFGNPMSTGFYLWDWYKQGDGSAQFAPGGGIYTVSKSDWSDATITATGKLWQDQLGIQDWDGNTNNGWTTQLTATTDANGQINFNGYYGDYTVTVGGHTYNLSLGKGTTNYSVGFPAGDLNFDNKVDAADYVVWRKGLGTTYTQSDYNIWRAHFLQPGSGSGADETAAVPEPATLVLMILAAAGWCFQRRWAA